MKIGEKEEYELRIESLKYRISILEKLLERAGDSYAEGFLQAKKEDGLMLEDYVLADLRSEFIGKIYGRIKVDLPL